MGWAESEIGDGHSRLPKSLACTSVAETYWVFALFPTRVNKQIKFQSSICLLCCDNPENSPQPVTKAPPLFPVPAPSSLSSQPTGSQPELPQVTWTRACAPGSSRGRTRSRGGKSIWLFICFKSQEAITTYKSTQVSNGCSKQLSQEPAPAWTASWLVKLFLKFLEAQVGLGYCISWCNLVPKTEHMNVKQSSS